MGEGTCCCPSEQFSALVCTSYTLRAVSVDPITVNTHITHHITKCMLFTWLYILFRGLFAETVSLVCLLLSVKCSVGFSLM